MQNNMKFLVVILLLLSIVGFVSCRIPSSKYPNSTKCCYNDLSFADNNVIVDSNVPTACSDTIIALYTGGIATFTDFKVHLEFAQLGCSCPSNTECPCTGDIPYTQCSQPNPIDFSGPLMCQLYVGLFLLTDFSQTPTLTTLCNTGGLPVANGTSVLNGPVGGTLLAYDNYIVRSCEAKTIQRFDWSLCQDCFQASEIQIPQAGSVVVDVKYWCNSVLTTNTAGFWVKGWATYGIDPGTKLKN